MTGRDRGSDGPRELWIVADDVSAGRFGYRRTADAESANGGSRFFDGKTGWIGGFLIAGQLARLGGGRPAGRLPLRDDFQQQIVFAAALFAPFVGFDGDRVRCDGHRDHLHRHHRSGRFGFPLRRAHRTQLASQRSQFGRADHFSVNVQRTQTGPAGKSRTVFLVETTRLSLNILKNSSFFVFKELFF